MVMRYADPVETLFAFQRALENRLSSDWLGKPRPQWAPIHPSTCSSKEMT